MKSTDTRVGMKMPLEFSRRVRAAGKLNEAGHRVFFDNFRTVNVVTHTQTLTGPPGPWAGYVPRQHAHAARRPPSGRRSSNFTQQRQTVGGGGKRSVILVFRSMETGEPRSKILAGPKSVPAAVANVYQYEATNGTTAPGNSVICVHNVVASAEIVAEGLTLDALSKSPLVVSTTKFPGANWRPAIRQGSGV